jgi:hypothetical protein
MSLLVASEVTATATAALAFFAIVTAILAGLAFRKQSAEVGILGKQLEDQQALTQQQAELLKVQSGQLDLQSRQFEEQRKVNEKQTGVLDLQAQELEASLAQRTAEAERQHRAQADQVTTWFAQHEAPARSASIAGAGSSPVWGAVIRNDSALPILNTRVFFYFISAESPEAVKWRPIDRGGPPERIRVIPPHSENFVPIPSRIRDSLDKCDDSVYAVGVEFGDAAGNYWERYPSGILVARMVGKAAGLVGPPLTLRKP